MSQARRLALEKRLRIVARLPRARTRESSGLYGTYALQEWLGNSGTRGTSWGCFFFHFFGGREKEDDREKQG